MDASQESVLIQVRNRVGHLRLNRSKALNALDLAMVRTLKRQLREWERDPEIVAVTLRTAADGIFCAGGDLRALYASHQAGDDRRQTFFSEEYALDQYLHAYGKPVVALVDGLVLGGGMGLVQAATLRVISERTRMGMPEVSIGFFPDVGGSYFLSRLPGRLGEYLGVTGQQVCAADALYAGLADVCVASARLSALDAALDHLDWHTPAAQTLSALLAGMSSPQLDGGELHLHRAAIDAHFSQPDIHAICTALEHEHSDWSARTLAMMQTRSPLAMGITLELLRRGRTLERADCFALEQHLGQKVFAHGEFIEGIRALLIDKDNTPHWNPARIAQLKPAHVQAFFA